MQKNNNFLFTSESVSEGHPDKVCDRISDMVVDSYLSREPFSRVACETLTTTNKVVLAGEIRGPKIDKEEIINTEVKDLRDGIGKYVEFTVVETDKKGGKYRIINCFPSEEPQDSIIKTVKTNYKLSN